MNENYIVINGKRADLTTEQLKALGVEVEAKRKNPFEKVIKGDRYRFVNAYGDVDDYAQADDTEDDALFKACNYFNDDSIAQQVALHQLLYRKLLKFAYDNECEDTAEWDCRNRHYHIIYSFNDKDFDFDGNDAFKRQGTVYFSSEKGALQAISEVVEPFMKDHPEFKW